NVWSGAPSYPRTARKSGLRRPHTPHAGRGSGGVLAVLDGELGFLVKCFKDHAISLGQLHQRGDLVGAGVAHDVEAQTDGAKAHRRGLVDAERAAEVEIALGADRAALE